MGSEEPKRIADYFVVVGLPKENPQVLDESALEDNFRATAHQDPITDVTVIFPGLGENVPDYYQLVDMTPTGLSANLNHGSIRAPEVFLCYRRSRARPPLLDLDVIYKGKDRIAPDFQVVEFTPCGHSANVNNTTNSATYLTYRRSNELSPCNELVVTDICVIITSKGESPPHSFKIIDKTLNKGMIGADVYICFKRSMNRPDLISYKPAIQSRFPLKDNPIYPLEDNHALLCLPMGATLECWPADSARKASAVSSTFVLTLPTREKVYGSAIAFYEEYAEDLLTEEQKGWLQLQKYKKRSDRKVLANRCICVLSRWPFYEAFENFLFFLHKRQLMGPFDVPLERFVSHFLFDVPFPSPERPRILVHLDPAAAMAVERDKIIAFFQPEEVHLPRSGASFRALLHNLSPDNCLLLLLLALTEQNVLIHSLRPAVLTSVAEAVMQIIFPFIWQCPYIPLCPIGMADYLAAPLPFVIGLDSRFFDLYDQPANVNAVDLDSNTITLCQSFNNSSAAGPMVGGPPRHHVSTRLLPKKAAKALRAELEALQEKCVFHNKEVRKLEATMDDGAIDFVFKMKRRELELEMEIREAFLRFVATIMAGYSAFLKPITSAVSARRVGATDTDNLFDCGGFLRSRDRSYHTFYTMLMRTQMFTKFIEERSFVSDTNTALAFFDECIHKVVMAPEDFAAASATTTVSTTTANATNGLKFLELEDFDSDRTVFILPPDTSDLPPGSVYHYDKFENLNPDLFDDKTDRVYAGYHVSRAAASNRRRRASGGVLFSSPELNGDGRQSPDANVGGKGVPTDPSSGAGHVMANFTTPSSLAKRTKQEIRSAQKSAQRLRRTEQQQPLSWTTCLVSTAYSLWFIHMPGYVLSSRRKPDQQLRALRGGLAVLQRTRRLRLHRHVDEICYRVMMQLCGLYGQPVLAVKVLCEMKMAGSAPNAVTYGHYNKAVLESEWPSGEEDHDNNQGQIMWRKLKNVVDAAMMFRAMGKKAAFRPSHHQFRSQQQPPPANPKAGSSSSGGSKADLDSVSRSSQESTVSAPSTLSSKLLAAAGGLGRPLDELALSSGLDEAVQQKTRPGDELDGAAAVNVGEGEGQGETSSTPLGPTEELDMNNKVDSVEGEEDALPSLRLRTKVESEAAIGSEEGTAELATTSAAEKRLSTIVRQSDSIDSLSTDVVQVSECEKDEEAAKTEDDAGNRDATPRKKHGRNGASSVGGSGSKRDSYGCRVSLGRKPNDSGVTGLGDLNPDSFGEDKKIVDLIQQQEAENLEEQQQQQQQQIADQQEGLHASSSVTPSVLSSLAHRQADSIRGKLSNLFGRHNPVPSGVNRVLFKEDDDDDEDDEEAGTAGPGQGQSQSQSQEGAGEAGDPERPATTGTRPSQEPETLPLPTNGPDQAHFALGSPEHMPEPESGIKRAASSSSVRLEVVPVMENDPLGALTPAAKSPANNANPVRAGLTKSATCPNDSLLLDNVSVGSSHSLAGNGVPAAATTTRDDILGSPFSSSMTRSTTLPPQNANNSSNPSATPTAFSLSSIKGGLSKSKLSSSLRKTYLGTAFSSLSPAVPSKKKTQEALSQGLFSIKSAYSNVTSTVSRRVEEFREYQATTPSYYHAKGDNNGFESSSHQQQQQLPGLPGGSCLAPDPDAFHPAEAGAPGQHPRRPSDFSATSSDYELGWTSLPSQLWEHLGAATASLSGSAALVDSRGFSASSSTSQGAAAQPVKSVLDLCEDFYSNLAKRFPGRLAMQIMITSCSRCFYCKNAMYDEEIMSGWGAEDSNLNTKCAFCSKSVVPFLTVHVVDFRTRSAGAMAALASSSSHTTPAPSVESFCSSLSSAANMRNHEDMDKGAGVPRDAEVEVEVSVASAQHDFPASKADSGPNPQQQQQKSLRCPRFGGSSMSVGSGATAATGASAPHHHPLPDPIISEPITVPYLSPLVLRKELESMLEREGDHCLVDPRTVDAHPIIYWNLIWFFERIAVKSHLPGLCLAAESLNKEPESTDPQEEAGPRRHGSWRTADHLNVEVICKWDNVRFHDDSEPSPIYTQWRSTVDGCLTDLPPAGGSSEVSAEWLRSLIKEQGHPDLRPLMDKILSGVSKNDLLQPIKSMLEARQKSAQILAKRAMRVSTAVVPDSEVDPDPDGEERHRDGVNGNRSDESAAGSPPQPDETSTVLPDEEPMIHPRRSVYREIMFLTLVSIGQDNIDLTAFDREYKRAFDKLPQKYLAMTYQSDRPPTNQVIFCRKMFRRLLL